MRDGLSSWSGFKAIWKRTHGGVAKDWRRNEAVLRWGKAAARAAAESFWGLHLLYWDGAKTGVGKVTFWLGPVFIDVINPLLAFH